MNSYLPRPPRSCLGNMTCGCSHTKTRPVSGLVSDCTSNAAPSHAGHTVVIAASLLTVAGAALAYTSFPFNTSKSAPRRAGRYVIAGRLSNRTTVNLDSLHEEIGQAC